MRSFLKSLLGRILEKSPSDYQQLRLRKRDQRRARPCLTVELLEDRVTPSVNWVGANADWNASVNNWLDTADNSHHFPITGNDVRIENGAAVTFDTTVEINTLSIGSTSGLSVNGGTLTIDSDSTLSGNVSVVNGNIRVGDAASDVVHVGGLLTLLHGALIGPGTITIAADAGVSLQTNGGGFTLDGCRFDNNGTATWTSNAGQPLFLQNGAVFTNNGTFDIQIDSQIANGGGAASAFNNNGAFKKTAGTGGGAATSILVPFNNNNDGLTSHGRVDVQAGELLFRSSGTSTGPWAVAASAQLSFFGSAWQLNAGSTVSGAGTVLFAGQAVDFADTYNVAATVFQGGKANFNAAASTTTLTLGSGILGGSGNFTVNGLLTWTNEGNMTGAGTTFANGGININITGGNTGLDGRRLDNNGTATMIGSLGLVFSNGAEFANNGTFDVHIDNGISNSGVPSTFINNGTFKKSAGTGTTSINVPFNNNGGTVAVQAGEMIFRAGGTSSGPWTVAASSTLTFISGNYALNAGSKMSGNGTVNFNGDTITLADTDTVANTNILTHVTCNADPTFQNLTMGNSGGAGALLDGSADVTINGLFTWSSGTMTGIGKTFANGGINFSPGGGGGVQLDGRQLDNAVNQTATWTSSGSFLFINGAVFNNRGIFDDQVGGTLFGSGTGPTAFFNNIGTFKKTAGNSAAVSSSGQHLTFNNTGTVEARSGSLDLHKVAQFDSGTSTLTGGTWKVFANAALTLQDGFSFTNNATIVLDGPNSNLNNTILGNSGSFTIQNGRNFNPVIAFNNSGVVNIGANSTFTLTNGGTSTGDWTIDATGSLLFSAGSANYLLDNGTDITGAGIATIAGGTVNVGDSAADVVNAAHFTLSFGNLGGPGTLNVTDALIWSSGIMQGNGTTHVANTATFALNGNNPRLDTRTLTNDGTATTSVNGGLDMLNGALFDNNGALTATNSSAFGSGGAFRNDGTFTKTGAGTTTRFDAIFNNNGTVNVDSGTLDLAGGGTSTGAAFAIGSGTNLFFSGSYTVDAASSISGAGAVDSRGSGTVIVNGSYTITGATTVSNTTNFNTATTFPTLNLSGILGGSGNVLIASALNWTGNGTMAGNGTTTVANIATLTMTANNTFMDGRTVINNGTATLTGGGSLFFQNGAVFDNNGAFTTTGSFGYASVPGGGAFHNSGSFTRIGSGSTTAFSPAFSNSGTVDVQTGTLSFTNVTNLSGDTLTGGTWIVRSNATLNTPGSNITTNQANVTLDGANSSFPKLDAITTNGATGAFTIQNGRNFTSAGAFSNAGSMTIGAGTTFATAANNYTQTGGTTTVHGTLDPAASADIQGGTLAGTGTVLGTTTNAGTVSPGASPGLLIINGNYTQSSAGTLNVEINGASAVQFDQLAVNGQVSLAGNLTGTRLTGFAPAIGTSFTIISNDGVDAVTGAFTQGNTVVIGGVTFNINYGGGDGNDVVLTVAAPNAVFVDDSWAGTSLGADPANDPIGGLVFGYNTFSDIPSAGAQVAANGTVEIFGGTYAAAVDIDKNLQPILIATNTTTPAQTLVTIQGGVILDVNVAVNTLSADLTVSGQVSGAGSLTKTGPGTLTLTNSNTYVGGTTINAGAVKVSVDDNLGNAAGGLTINAGTLQATATFSSSRTLTLGDTAATIQVDPGQTLTRTAAIGGGGSLSKTGGGTLDLSSLSNTYGGAGQATNVLAGTLRINADAGLGDSANSIGFGGGTLQAAAGFTTSRNVTLNAGGGTLDAGAFNVTLASPGVIAGAGGLAKLGVGTLTLTGANTYAGGTTINAGELAVSADNNLGNGGGVTINAGTLSATGTFASTRSFTLGNALSAIQVTGGQALTVNSAIGGAGALTKLGAGNLVLAGANTYAGGAAINAGALFVNGSATSGVTVNAGGTLGGGGSIAGAVTVKNNGTLSAGQSPGALTVGSLSMETGSSLTEEINANVAGSGYDQINVTGAAALNGALNVIVGGGLNPQGGDAYRILTFASVSGDFASTTGFALGSGRFLQERFNPAVNSTSLDLLVVEQPIITSAQSATFTVGIAGTFTVQTTGFPSPTLTRNGALPGGVSFLDNGNGTATLSGTPSAGASGSFPFTITAHNGVGSDFIQNFSLTVNQAAAITSTDHETFSENSFGTFTVTTTGFPTPTLVKTGALPTGVAFTDNGDGTATIEGTPAAGTNGAYPITITAHNGVGSDFVQDFILSVFVNPPPVVGTPSVSPTSTSEGTSTSFTISGTFTDPSGAAAAPFTAVIHWGDNTTDTATVSGADNPFSYSFSGSHIYAQSGTRNVTVSVTNVDGATGTSAAVPVSVANVAPTVGTPVVAPTNASEGVSATFSVTGTFTDPAGALDQPYVATIHWGDGTTSPATVSGSANPFSYGFNGAHLYAQDGSFNVTVSVTDKDNGTGASAATIVNVANVAPSVGTPVVSPTSANEGANTSYTVNGTFTDPAGALDQTFVATVHWGDGTTDAAIVAGSGNPFSYSFSGNHTYAQSGPFNVTVSVTDRDNGAGASAATVVSVANVAPTVNAPAINPTATTRGANVSFNVNGTFTDPAGALDQTYTAVIRWGDSTTSTATVTGSGNPFGYAFTGNHTYTSSGPSQVTVSVTDNDGSTGVSAATTVNVANPVTISPTTLPAGTAGVLYNQVITAANGTGNKAMLVTNYSAGGTGLAAPSAAPNTLTFNSTPSAAGNVSFDVTATDTVGATAARHYAFVINAAAGGGVTDNFNRPNGPLGPSWDTLAGTYAIQAGEAAGAAALNLVTFHAATAGDVALEVKLNLTAAGQSAGLAARHSGPGDANMYLGNATFLGGNTYRVNIWKNVGGAFSLLFEQVVNSVPSPVLRFELAGPSLKLFLGGDLRAFAQDTTFATGAVGIRTTIGAKVDDFAAAVITLPTTQTLPFTDSFVDKPTPPGKHQLSTNWLERAGAFETRNPQVTGVGGDVNLATVNGIVASNEDVQAHIAFTAVGQYVGLVARYSGSGDQNMYLGNITVLDGSRVEAGIYRNTGGEWTALATQVLPSSVLVNAGGLLRFRVAGSSLQLLVGNTLVAFAKDSTFAAGMVGMRLAANAFVSDFTAATAAAPLSFADPFNAAPLNPTNWLVSDGSFNVVSGKAAAQSSPINLATPQGVSLTDADVQASVSFTAAGQHAALAARHTGSGDQNMYLADVESLNAAGTNVRARLLRNVGGTWTQIGPSQDKASFAGLLRFKVTGTTLELLLDAVSILSLTDAAIAGPGSVGMRGTQGTSFDNFSAS